MAAWILTCLALQVGAQPTELHAEELHAEEPQAAGYRQELSPAETALAEQGAPGSSREEKFLSVFQIVKFKNGACPASDGNMGVCFTEAECSAKGGISGGACASGFGVCCVFTVMECDSTVTENNTYIQSADYPAAAPAGMCMYNLNKCDSNICQFRLEFEDVEMGAPASGDCNNDTMMVTGMDAVSVKVVPMTLCGTLSGQHMILTVKDQAQPGAKLVFNHESGTAKWRVRVVQYSCEDTVLLAPAGCVTYEKEPSGNLQSYNVNGGNGELINNQKFSHCIQNQDGYCDVALTSSTFDLGTDDNLSFGNNIQTGQTFGDSGSLPWNFTGPYVATTCANGDNAAMNAGYDISYLLLPC